MPLPFVDCLQTGISDWTDGLREEMEDSICSHGSHKSLHMFATIKRHQPRRISHVNGYVGPANHACHYIRAKTAKDGQRLVVIDDVCPSCDIRYRSMVKLECSELLRLIDSDIIQAAAHVDLGNWVVAPIGDPEGLTKHLGRIQACFQ